MPLCAKAIGLFLLILVANLTPTVAAQGDAFIIVANKTYRSGLAAVEFADRDGDAVEKVAREVLGVDRSGLKRFDDMTGSEASGWFQPSGMPGDDLTNFVRRASQGRRDATIYFYYSGHGVTARNGLSEKDELHLVLHDTRTDAVGRQGLSIEAVKAALAHVQKQVLPNGRVVMLIDACFSGFGRDGKEVYKGARAGAVSAKLASVPSVVVLAAAGPAESAWSDLNRRHGAFTDAIVDGLYGGAADDKGQITAERLLAFVGRRVAARLSRQPGGERQQTPMMAGDGQIVIASVKTSALERVPGTRMKFELRCSIVGASTNIGMMRTFLKEECDDDCPCRSTIEASIAELEHGELRCKLERDQLAALMAGGLPARAGIEALGRVAQCSAVKAEIAAGATELLCRKERDEFLALRTRGAAARSQIEALGRAAQCSAVKVEVASAIADIDEGARKAANLASEAKAKEAADAELRREAALRAEAARREQEEARKRAEAEARDRAEAEARKRAAAEARQRAQDEARLRAEADARRRSSLAEMKAPIDNLFQAWNSRDIGLYIDQWASDGIKVDLRKGTRQSRAALRADRAQLFDRLSNARVAFSAELRDSGSDVANFQVSYSLSIQYKTGRSFSESACERYRVERRGERWLIVLNEDYAPCR